MNQQQLYIGPRQELPVSNGGRAGSSGRQDARQPAPVETSQSLAARFEDEKKRIIESCFHKRDPDGMQLESYITHVRVTEDASYPSSPPPPDSPPSNKKPRVILVAVRRSGKVRVHKARENPNGTFSIGKTWSLDELNAITSYTSMVPETSQQQMEKQWAANTGFIVTLGKPYFWAADTAKEKDFFIASLIKIYRKYTGGRIPELIGFGQHEIAQITGIQPPQSTPTHNAALSPVVPPDRSRHLPPPPAVPVLSVNRPQSPYTGQTTPSGDGTRVDSTNEKERGYRHQGYLAAATDGSSSRGEDRPVGRLDRDRDHHSHENPRSQQPYGARFRRDDGRVPSLADSVIAPSPRPSISPKASQSSLQRSETSLEPPPLRPNGYGSVKPAGLEPAGKKLVPAPSQDSVRSGGGSEPYNSRRPSNAAADHKAQEAVPSMPGQDVERSPERKKSIPAVSDSRSEELAPPSQDNSTFVTPLGTPSGLHEDEQPKKDVDYFAGQKPQQQGKSTENANSGTVPPQSTHLQITSEPMTAEPMEAPPIPKAEEEHRPGLGPMIKKKSEKDIANRFRKAALAATAFQPRQGGAAARLKALQERQSNEPDGITSVVPAPLLRGMSTDSARSGPPDLATPAHERNQPTPTPKPVQVEPIPKVKIERSATSDSVARPETPAVTAASVESEGPKQQRAASPDKARSRSPQRRRRQKLEAEVEKHCAILGIDPRILDGRGADFNELLTEFGWEGRLPGQQKVEDFETDIRREIGRAQASGWLGHLEQQESKVQELATAFDNAIAECEELDGLLTLYAHELDTLHDDIEYIEAQGQGLQVQTANQKLLQSELETLLKTLTISTGDLRALHSAPIDSVDGVQAVERSLSLLYRAMLTIDPELRQNKLRQAAASSTDGAGVPVYADANLVQMRAVQQKKEEYRQESMAFINRFNQHMKAMFQMAEQRTSEENAASISSGNTITLNLRAYSASRQDLWMYHALMLFVREVNQYEWQTLISSYEINVKAIYQEQFRDFTMSLRRTVRKPSGEEQEILFTHQEKEKVEESLTSTAARKLTVRRGKTLKTSALRQSIGDKREGKPEAWVVFDTVVGQQTTAIAEEQNFIVHFFHLESQSNADFAEVVQTQPPEQRKVPDLQAKQSYDPDRNMAKVVQDTTEGIYGFWVKDLQALIDWVLRMDQLQGVGVLVSLEQCMAKYEETNQEFITRTMRALHERVIGLFHKFVEEQVKAIEETKVKVKKRKGLISFMRVFPEFSSAVEDMIPQEFAHQDSLEVRFIVNDAYTKLLKAMWESLSFIAKDNPASSTAAVHSAGAPTSGDPEDKEALNYHILLIENMNYFAEEVKTHHNVVLEEWAERASRDQLMHLAQYADAVIRRPLGKWLDFLESTEALMRSTDSYASIANKPSHSRSSAKKILATHDAKEVRKGIETLKKRIEKHFTDADDPNNSSNKALIGRVLDECATRYAHAYDRMKLVIDRVYDSSLEIDWRKEDAAAMFRR